MNRELATMDPSNIVRTVKWANLTYLSERKLLGILKTLARIEREKVPGNFAEAGCALGGSAIVIAKHMGQTRLFEVYDVFGQIPPPTQEDPPEVHARYDVIRSGSSSGIGGDTYYGYIHDLKQVVQRNLTEHLAPETLTRVHLIEGLLEDTLQPQGPVAFVHVDVDWYQPVKTCLERLGPQLSLGGSIILDDYLDWGGCKKAVDEYLLEHGSSLEADSSFGNFIITRK